MASPAPPMSSLDLPIPAQRAPSAELRPPPTPKLSDYVRDEAQVFVWGRGDLGQLGLGESASCDTLKPLHSLEGKFIAHASAGLFNTAFVSRDGELFTTGDNELGQLGVRTSPAARLLEPARVQALETSSIVHVSVGLGHMVAVTDKGGLASWGGAEFGQLGQGGIGVSSPHPRLIRSSREAHFVQVACGACHTLALTSSGQVYSFGQGTFGALGHGDDSNAEAPALIEKLWPVGVVQVSAGENHSAALTVDGRLLTWGRGKYGQLGLGDFYSKQAPSHVKALVGVVGVQVCCGGNHTMLLSRRGEVYSWGSGTWGQTGLGSNDNTCLPQKIEALLHRRIVQVAAGARHSLALESTGALYAFGNSEEGQLAGAEGAAVSGSTFSGVASLNSPRRVALAQGLFGPNCQPAFLVAGGDISALVMVKSRQQGDLCTLLDPGVALGEGAAGAGMLPMQLPSLLDLADAATARKGTEAAPRDVQAMVRAIEAVFTSPGFMIAGFMRISNSPPGGGAGDLGHGMEMDVVKEVYNAILCTYNSEVVVALATSTSALLDACERAAGSPAAAPQAEWLKALLVVSQNPVLGDNRHGPALVRRLASVICSLTGPSQQMLASWMSTFSREDFTIRLVRPVQKAISNLCTSQTAMRDNRQELLQVVQLLDYLHEVNALVGELTQYEEFHNKELSENANLRDEYILCIDMGQMARGPIKSLCQVPFVFTPEAKSRILQGEANLQKRHMLQNSNFQALLTGVNPAQLAWLHICVHRESILEDTLNQIVQHPQDLKKPLKVTFMSAGVIEEGLDEGGVAREFFMLLTRELFDVKFGMFSYLPETRTYWFNQVSMEPDINFRLVGILLGLAIYNSVILDIHMPMVIYKKLLGQRPDFQDLKQAMPELGRGLQQLLDFDGDVEEVMARNFEVEYECYGEMRTEELVDGGSSKPVTNANRHEYVELYTKWVLEDSIARQFEAFSEGFHEVCGGPALRLFRHEELELLVCGLPHLDFEALESVTRYDGGYNKKSPAVRSFWKVLHSLTLEQKKRFLLFTTGCDRAPVGGLGQLPLIIQRSGPDSNRLPTSHTCFHILLLPEYDSEAKTKERLLTAIDNAEGFGLQ